MDASPDVKRPRLLSDQLPYVHTSASLRHMTTPGSIASHLSHPDHPPLPAPAAASYPASTALSSPAHLPLSSGATPSQLAYPRQTGAEGHAPAHAHHHRPSHHPPSVAPSGFHDARPGYGPVAPPQSRLYAPEQEPSQSQSAPPPPPPPPAVHERQRRASASSDRPPFSMADPAHGSSMTGPLPAPLYPPLEQQQQQASGGLAPNGLQYTTHEHYAGGPVGHHPTYPPTPTSAYAPAHAYHQGPTNYATAGIPRRKQVRAQQACNNCRQRKQKCDEKTPCSYCATEQLDCVYREVPPPKTDKNTQDLLSMGRETLETGRETLETLKGMITMLRGGVPSSQLAENATKLESPSQETSGLQRSYQHVELNLVTPVEKSYEPSLDTDEQVPDQPPSSHETGAQYLQLWPRIEEYFKQAGVKDHQYVQEDAERAGTLRLYGYSWVENGHLVEDDIESHDGMQVSDQYEDCWGDGFLSHNTDPFAHTNVGGANPDGSLDLSAETVRDLYDSYMRNMWVMHPFLDAAWLRDRIEIFIRNHSPLVKTGMSTEGHHFAVPTMPASGGRPVTPASIIGKRKRQSNAGEDPMDYEYPRQQTWQPPKKAHERSMTNCIILLVLALGKMLAEQNFLLDEFSQNPSSESSERSYANSPADATHPSPRGYAAFATASSPGDYKNAAIGRNTQKRRKVPNFLLFPGLAYFAQATDILGNNHGGNEIIHAQAFLLAGLYYGQMGRAMESWSWINEACRVTTVLHKKEKYRDSLLANQEGFPLTTPPWMNPECTVLATLCWSALQLESDLRAELDQLPKPSQLMFAEPKIVKPAYLPGTEGDNMVRLHRGPPLAAERILKSYHFQIGFRLILNRVHAALYSKKSQVPQDRKKRTTVVWSESDTSTLFDILQNTRDSLVRITPYNWEDGAPEPEDLLAARLRAKYYGAEYIILRPYLYNALRWEIETGRRPNTPFKLDVWLQQHVQSEKERGERRVQQTRGNMEPEKTTLPLAEISYTSFQSDPNLASQFLWCCKRCIDAATLSTIAFDRTADPRDGRRLRVTNIHGTATAQFSNMLVLVAAFRSWLKPLVDENKVKSLMERTIILHDKLSPLAPGFRTNRRILEQARIDLYAPEQVPHARILWQGSPGSGPSMSPASAGASVSTPRNYVHHQHTPASAHTSFNSAKY